MPRRWFVGFVSETSDGRPDKRHYVVDEAIRRRGRRLYISISNGTPVAGMQAGAQRQIRRRLLVKVPETPGMPLRIARAANHFAQLRPATG
jgi:hypothetical protein